MTTTEIILDAIKKIDQKIDRLDQRLDAVDLLMVKQQTILDDHVQRSTNLEARMKPLEEAQLKVAFTGKSLMTLITVTGILVAVFEAVIHA